MNSDQFGTDWLRQSKCGFVFYIDAATSIWKNIPAEITMHCVGLVWTRLYISAKMAGSCPDRLDSKRFAERGFDCVRVVGDTVKFSRLIDMRSNQIRLE